MRGFFRRVAFHSESQLPRVTSRTALLFGGLSVVSVAEMKERHNTTTEPVSQIDFRDVNVEAKLILFGVGNLSESVAFAVYVDPCLREAVKHDNSDEALQEVIFARVTERVDIRVGSDRVLNGSDLALSLKSIIGGETRNDPSWIAFFGQFDGHNFGSNDIVSVVFEYPTPRAKCRVSTIFRGRTLVVDSESLGKALMSGFLSPQTGIRSNFEQRRETFLRETKWIYQSDIVLVH